MFTKATKEQSQGKVFIYTLEDPVSSEVRYVGKTENLEKRYKEHLNGKGKTHKCCWINKLLKNGLQPLMKVLEEATSHNWQERERFWILYFRSIGTRLTNATDGGDGVVGLKHSDKTKALMRQLCKGRIVNPEIGRKVGAALKGRSLSEEHKAKLRGRERSLNERKKLSIARTGMRFSDLHKANISIAKKGKPAWNKGLPMSEQQRLAVSLAQRKLSESQVLEIGYLLSQGGLSQRKIALAFDVSPATVNRIKQGKSTYGSL